MDTLAQQADQIAWYIPILIFFARICDVSIGTLRTMLMVGGARYWAAALGAVEVTIWVLAVGWVLLYLPKSPLALVAYAAGFSCGILVGMVIEDRLAVGFRVVRVISPYTAGQPGEPTHPDLSTRLRERGYAVTRVDASGRNGPVEMAFMVVPRRRLAALQRCIDEIAPQSFVTVERAERPSRGMLTGHPSFGTRPASRVGDFVR